MPKTFQRVVVVARAHGWLELCLDLIKKYSKTKLLCMYQSCAQNLGKPVPPKYIEIVFEG